MAKPIQNFWQLVQTHRIEIPIIQRDYVQGQNSSKTNPIREEFVKVIRTALKDAKTLHLNFIYGKINGIQNAQQLAKNTEAVKNMLSAVQSYSQSLDLDINFSVDKKKNNSDGTHYTSFIPLDGQQRLTTLYLIHWYVLKRLKNEDDLKILMNFSYKIRPSSRDFCEALVEKSDFEIKGNEALSKQITNRSWYFLHWAKDPTVRSMLNMLDTIHQAFANDNLEDLKTYWQRLTNETNPVIRFEFLNLKDYDLTDELYIKMNARGKPLTDFENFKAWLMEYVEKHEIKIDESLNWKHNLDTKWADLFWNNKGEGNYTIDQAYMNFFRNMFQIFYVQDKEFDAENKEQRENAQALTDSKNLLSYSFYEKIGVLTEKGLNIIFEIIDLLSDKKKGINWISDQLNSIDFFNGKRTLFKAFVSGNMSYPDKVRFSAMIIYLLKNKEDTYSETAFVSWMRVIRNLVTNTTVDDIRPFKRAIHSLAELAKSCSNIYEDFEEIGYRGFSINQYSEEETKVKLIKREVISEVEFLKYENHKYFKAEIGFLLDLSLENRDKFLEYGEKCAFIFGDKFDNSNFLLEQAFLATHNYLIPKGGNHTFLNIKEWKQSIFKTSYLLFFQGLLDKIEGEKDIVKELEKIKDSYTNNDWRKLLIDYPAAMRYCKRNRIRIYKNADEIRLLEGIVLGENRGQNRELHSYCFYLKIKRKYENQTHPLQKIKYHTISGYSTVPCAFLNAITKTKIYNYAIDIYFVSGEYNLRFFNRNENYVEDTVIDVLYDLGFHRSDKGSYFYENIVTMNEVEQALLDICDELPQFKISTR